MNILLDKRELKKAAKELSVLKINEVINALQEVLTDRQREIETIEKLQAFAKSKALLWSNWATSYQAIQLNLM